MVNKDLLVFIGKFTLSDIKVCPSHCNSTFVVSKVAFVFDVKYKNITSILFKQYTFYSRLGEILAQLDPIPVYPKIHP